MKVFITGIAGFVGSTVATSLAKSGVEVFGVDNLRSGSKDNLPSFVPWELLDIRSEGFAAEFSRPCEAVIHLAAQASGERSFEEPIYDMDTNLKGSYHAFQFAKRARARLFINMSSMSVYGNVLTPTSVTEESVTSPVSLYGNTKLAAERMLALLGSREKIPVVSLRLFNAYGPKQNLDEMKQGMVSIYLAQFLRSDNVIVKGDPERVRDFVYVDDIVSAIRKILEHPRPEPGSYNLSTGAVTTVKHVLERLGQETGMRKEIVFASRTPGDIQGFAGDSTKLQEKFHWKSTVTFDEGVKKMVQSYMEKETCRN